MASPSLMWSIDKKCYVMYGVYCIASVKQEQNIVCFCCCYN